MIPITFTCHCLLQVWASQHVLASILPKITVSIFKKLVWSVPFQLTTVIQWSTSYDLYNKVEGIKSVLSTVICTGTKTFLDKHQVQCVGSSHKSILWIPKHVLYHKHDFTCIDQDFNLYLLYIVAWKECVEQFKYSSCRCYMCTHTHKHIRCQDRHYNPLIRGAFSPSCFSIGWNFITVVVNPGNARNPPIKQLFFWGEAGGMYHFLLE